MKEEKDKLQKKSEKAKEKHLERRLKRSFLQLYYPVWKAETSLGLLS